MSKCFKYGSDRHSRDGGFPWQLWSAGWLKSCMLICLYHYISLVIFSVCVMGIQLSCTHMIQAEGYWVLGGWERARERVKEWEKEGSVKHEADCAAVLSDQPKPSQLKETVPHGQSQDPLTWVQHPWARPPQSSFTQQSEFWSHRAVAFSFTMSANKGQHWQPAA